MKTNNLRFLLAAGIAGVMPFHNLQAQNQKDKPNVIFILTDDLGYGDLGVLFQNQLGNSATQGIAREFTPNLDRMANNGVQLPQQYCAAPVCAPSRASLLLGQSQGHANVRDNQFDKALEDNYTLGSVMQKAGYATVAIGKWGLQGKDNKAPNWTAHPLNRGFDYFLGYIRHKDGHEHYPKEGVYDGAKEVWENRTNIAAELDKCYTTDLWTAAAKKWITNHEKGKDAQKPFFMYLAYDTPHAALELPTQSYPSGGGIDGGVQWLGEPGRMINTATGKVDSWIHPDYANATYDDDHDPTTPEIPWQDIYKRYATDTRRIDNAVGDLLKLLRDLKIDENTIVIFTSDNGPSRESYLPGKPYQPTFFQSFGPFDGIKRDCWEGGVRMPTLAFWPGHFPAGRVVESPSISYDWMATLADVAGLPAPAVSDGVSLLPSLTGSGKQAPSNIYVEYFNNGTTPEYSDFSPNHQGRIRRQMQMIRLGDFVGVRYNIQSADDSFEIYNVIKDPKQTQNLANDFKMDSLQTAFRDIALQSRMPNPSAPRPYDDALVPSVTESNTKPGLIWSAYRGAFPWLPQVSGLNPVKSGITDFPKVGVSDEKDVHALYFEGLINVPSDGEYTFYLAANSKALLRIHNATVIDDDYEYFSGSPQTGKMRLKSGLHPIRIYYMFEGRGHPSLHFGWSGSGIKREEIPASAFFHEESK